MEFIPQEKQISLEKSGVVSRQILSPHNSTSKRVTITEVTVAPGVVQERHIHRAS